jgi:hypothetical protein
MAGYLGKPHGQGNQTGAPQQREAKSLMNSQMRSRSALDYDRRATESPANGRMRARTQNGRGR